MHSPSCFRSSPWQCTFAWPSNPMFRWIQNISCQCLAKSLGMPNNKFMRHQELSQSTQDYLKHLHHLGNTSSKKLAETLGVTPASVTGKLKILQQQGLVQHVPYQTIALTEAGERLAQQILRHHQLLSLYLHQVLGYSQDEARREAETLEHHISEKLENRLFELLGHPRADLDGRPIDPFPIDPSSIDTAQRSTLP